jgi:serine/threonine protein kinase
MIEDEREKSNLMDLLGKMLDINYKTRITPNQAFSHPFFNLSEDL